MHNAKCKMQNYPIKVDFRASAKINIKKLIFTLQTAKTELSISFSILHFLFCSQFSTFDRAEIAQDEAHRRRFPKAIFTIVEG